jgi:S-DNA-T family DNA segregation ATPase FtsK/SpoIIIE
VVSYDVCDTADWSGGQGARNYIGPLGAWTAWAVFRLFGAAGFLVPAMLAVLGLFLVFKSEDRFWPRAAWMGGILAGCCVLAGMSGDFWATARLARYDIGGMPGGFVGYLLGEQLLVRLIGGIGTALLGTAVVLAGLFFVSGVRPAELWSGLRGGFAKWREERKERRRAALAEAAEREADSLRVERERVRLERELAKQRREQEAEERAAQKEREREEREAERRRKEQAAEEERQRKEREAEEAAERERQEAEERERREQEEKEALRKRLEEERRAAEEKKARDAEAARAAREAEALAAAAAAEEQAKTVWQLPPMELLDPVPAGAGGRASPEELEETVHIIQDTLAQFGIESEITHVEQGPSVTRYELLPAAGVKVERIGALSGNITLALKAESVRVEAPIPGKGVVGIEVPNRKAAPVVLREVLQSAAWTASTARLPLVLGEDVGGNVVTADLTSLPHLLVAGATSMGKSVCLNSILAGLLMSRTPEELGLILVDPKIVEFSSYAALPHLMVPVITEPKKVVAGLRWAILEMQRRFKLFHKANVRDIASFNSRPKPEPEPEPEEDEDDEGAEDVEDAEVVDEADVAEDGGEATVAEGTVPTAARLLAGGAEEEPLPEKLKYIVIVIDELADLMLEVQQDIEPQITKLTQLARATGIHLIIATQRPTVKIITGTIKANVPGRIAFKVAQKNDSRVILDREGADKLVRKGDMLAVVGGNKVIRAQGAWTKDNEIKALVEWWSKQGAPCFDASLQSSMNAPIQLTGKGKKGKGGGVSAIPTFDGLSTSSVTTQPGSDSTSGAISNFGATEGMSDEEAEDQELLEQVVEIIRQTQRASTSSIQRRLRIGYNRASRLMDMLEEKGLIGPARGAEPREILFDVGAAHGGQAGDGAGGGGGENN